MRLNLNVKGIEFGLRISNYCQTTKELVGDNWTVCDLHLKFENCLDYKIDDQEILLAQEIDELLVALNKIVNGKKLVYNELYLIEPDLEFVFTLYDENEYLMDLKVNLWNQGAATANYINLCFGKEEIKKLMVYLEWVVGKRDLNDVEIQKMLVKNNLVKA